MKIKGARNYFSETIAKKWFFLKAKTTTQYINDVRHTDFNEIKIVVNNVIGLMNTLYAVV